MDPRSATEVQVKDLLELYAMTAQRREHETIVRMDALREGLDVLMETIALDGDEEDYQKEEEVPSTSTGMCHGRYSCSSVPTFHILFILTEFLIS